MTITKGTRKQVFDKYGGRCAYCGCKLKLFKKDKGDDPAMQVDHITAKELAESDFVNTLDNLNPSCPRCNNWKSSMPLDDFRHIIEILYDGQVRDSSRFRMLLDYGIIQQKKTKVTFYFENRR